MRMYLLVAVVLVAVEVAAMTYWYESEAWDCGVHCSADQQAAGWVALVLPILAVGLAVVALVRLRRERNGSRSGEGAGELGEDG